MTARFVVRFDDISPSMDWSKFYNFEKLASDYGIPFLLGVIPNCLDTDLNIFEERVDFWHKVREWKKQGWTISQHGYTHQYINSDPGILKMSKKSEFAGLEYKEQKLMLQKGKKILADQGVWEPIFMAPSHSFDLNTIKALEDLEFKYITDGFGLYSYKISNLILVPQLFSKPYNIGFGVYTLCLHINTMSVQQVEKLLNFLVKKRKKIISFYEAASINSPAPALGEGLRFLSTTALRIFRKSR